jgi:uncharacterized protein (TIGR03067 family)
MSQLQLLAALCSLCGLTGLAQDKPRDDKELLQGRWDWDPAAKQSDAQPVIHLEHVVIKGDTVTFHYKVVKDGTKSTSTSRFTLDPNSSPKFFDFTPNEGGNKGKTYHGLYELKDGRLRICYRGPGSTRPKDFDDKHDPNTNGSTTFIVVKRAPPA